MTSRLDGVILGRCRREPEERCLWWRGTWWSWRAFSELVQCCSERLADGGFGPGGRLALVLPNSPLFWALTVAAWSLGGSVSPMNVQEGPHAVLKACSHLKASGAVVMEGAHDVLSLLRSSGLPAVASAVDRDQPSFALLEAGGTEVDEAVVFFTSGTTGRPKAVCITHGNLVDNVEAALERVVEIGDEDTILNVLPDFHALGFTVCGLLPLLRGLPQVLLPTFMPPETTLEAMRRSNVSVAVAVPTLLAYLSAALARGSQRPVDLKTIISGGDHLPRSLDDRCRHFFGVPVLEGYGLTEASPVVAVNPGYAARRPGTVGLPLPRFSTAIRDDGGQDLPRGFEGRLWLRGPSVAPGYLRCQGLGRDRFCDGWFDTGDIASIDEEGYLSIVSRASDIIIVSGFNVYPRDVEEVLRQHPSVTDVAVVGHPNNLSGEIVKAFIVPDGNGPIPLRELTAFCRERLPHFKVPRLVEYVSRLPRSAIGEVLKRELRSF